jgi:UDP-glucose 4-epimerase
MARILLTGATGFVGGAVLARLAARGEEILALGRTPPAGEGITFLPGDLGQPETLGRHRGALAAVDLAVHAGAAVLRSSSPQDEDGGCALRINAEGTFHLLSLLPPTLAGFCHLSTLDVYGPPETVPVTEDHPLRPATWYGASKLAAEAVVGAWSRKTGVPAAVLRLSQVYGPGDTSRKVIPNFLRAALAGEAPPVRGDGHDVRDWVFIDDVVDAVLAALERRPAGIYNIAGGTGTSLRELAAEICRQTGAPGPEWGPAERPPARIRLDVAGARAALAWSPRIDLAEGLRRTIGWMRGA